MKNRALPAAHAALAFCFLLPAVALGQAESTPSQNLETITIDAQNVLPGIWKFPPHERAVVWPKSVLNSPVRFVLTGPEKYCRIGRAAQGYAFNCLEIAERSPEASLDAKGQVHLSWRGLFVSRQTGCRWTFEGRLQSAIAMSGRLGMRCDSGSGESPRLMTITKTVLSQRTADGGGQAALLKQILQEIAAGNITVPFTKPHLVSSKPNVRPLPDDVQQHLMEFPTPDSLRPLGTISAVVYVGEYTPIVGWLYAPPHGEQPAGEQALGPVYGEKQQPIYAVEFENGERLCTLRRRPDGVIDRFQCV